MSEPLQVTDVWQRGLDATIQFYSALGKLTVEYMNSLLATTSDSITNMTPVAASTASTSDGGSTPAPTPSQPATVSTMVLEAPAGSKAMGVFLVENVLERVVSVSASTGPFTNDRGNEINASLEFQPPAVTLQPGEQALVKVVADISKQMAPGDRYRGEIGVVGLPGTRIPVVIGRTAETETRASGKVRSSSTARARRPTSNRKSPARKSQRRAPRKLRA
jgi:hypothetical protein